jgi:Leucine-rich repeat (LRR) protein
VKSLNRYARVSLRMTLVLLTITCVWVGKLSIDARRQKSAVEWIEKHGGIVRYDWQIDPQTSKLLPTTNPTPAWLRALLGDHCFQTAVVVDITGDVSIHEFSTLGDLPSVRFLQISDSKVADLAPLARMTKVETLMLGDNEIVDLSPLANLSELKVLYLDNNKVVDLTPLSSLGRLTTLVCSKNRVSDLSPIATLPNLVALDMSNNPISDLSPLATLPRIEMVRITGSEIVDCSPLLQLPTLVVADLHGNPGLSRDDDRKLQEYVGRARDSSSPSPASRP